ncbi:uncharacterized protein [Argopecten irradians]|uniref:uncharacterized protein n=1 Tax=Argopecten irradians TaxID=31199 RepID=UPI0037121318
MTISEAIMDIRICVLILIFGYVFKTSHTVSTECSSKTIHLSSFSQGNNILDGYTYRTINQVPNIQLCAEQCLLHRMCRSFNYNRENDQCDLNSENHIRKPEALSSSVTSKYYIIDGWPEFFLSGCEYHTCPETHVCVVNFQGLTPSYTCVEYSQPTYTIGCTNLFTQESVVTINSSTVRFSPVTCVDSVGDTFGTFIHNYRDGTFDWFNMRPIIEGCAGLAQAQSLRYFGIEFFGECWVAGTFVESSHTKIPANDCNTKTYLGVGGANVVCVYEII